MPCGKKPLIKRWDKSKDMKPIKPSRYQKNEASVKLHWRRVLLELELLYKDDKFWETQSLLVKQLVGEVFFERLIKIFNLPKDQLAYQPRDDDFEVEPSETFYKNVQRELSQGDVQATYSLTDFDVTEEASSQEEQSEEWSVSSVGRSGSAPSRSKQFSKSNKSLKSNKSIGAHGKSKSEVRIEFSKSKSMMSKLALSKSYINKFGSKSKASQSSDSEAASSDDDIKVHPKSFTQRRRHIRRNHHFELLYCNDSETDMIKWNSNYKQKKFEISASDEFSKKAELLTKEIAHGFYNWWISVGSKDYKSEIKRPDDIEELFQVWFDEHASRGLVLDPRIMPCVLESIANYVGVPKAACPKLLNRQIAFDIHADTKPAHSMAFGSCLPKKLKHIPARNNTKEMWRGVNIPEDLRTMSCVWGDITHLTSTKAFRAWLQQRRHMPMPPFFKTLDETLAEKKQLFVVPSDYMVREKDEGHSAQDLNIPISQFSLEIKEVLSKLLNE